MSNYYDYREVKVMIAHRLMTLDGWKVYGYSPDQSDSMTDYYCPAHWDGVAEKNGYVLCVDVYGAREPEEIREYNNSCINDDKNTMAKIKKLESMTVERGASEAEAASAIKAIEKLQKKAEETAEESQKYTVVDIIPGHQAHPTRCNWHIEKDGIIIAKGNGILKYKGLDSYYTYNSYIESMREFKTKSKEEYIKNNVDDLMRSGYYTDIEKARSCAEGRYNDMQETKKLMDNFDKFINKLDTTCGGLLGEGDGTVYEKVTVTKYKKEMKISETTNGSIKEGQCFILKNNFMYGKYKGLVYRIHEEKTKNGSYFYAYKLNGKHTKECTGTASQNNSWYSFGEKFLKWIDNGSISWCELKEEKVPYEVEKTVKKKVKVSNKTDATQKTEETKIVDSNYTYDITLDTDTRDDSNIWVVKVKEKLSREEYKQVNESMKTLGGYYSRFKHGFIFKENPESLLNSDIEANTDNPEESNLEEQPEEHKNIIEYDIQESKTPNNDKIIWLVKVKNEISKNDFAEVKQNLAKIQGYYSSLKDGFIFKYDPTEKLII